MQQRYLTQKIFRNKSKRHKLSFKTLNSSQKRTILFISQVVQICSEIMVIQINTQVFMSQSNSFELEKSQFSEQSQEISYQNVKRNKRRHFRKRQYIFSHTITLYQPSTNGQINSIIYNKIRKLGTKAKNLKKIIAQSAQKFKDEVISNYCNESVKIENKEQKMFEPDAQTEKKKVNTQNITKIQNI